MFHTKRAIVVEGKYDKIRLSALTDALILQTDGFGIFSDKEKQQFIKKTAREKGLMIITDSDAAGFQIRHFLENIASDADIVNVFIPDVYGKETRKAQPSKEGKIGVEGISTALLEEALRKSGAFYENDAVNADPITYTDLYEAGLSGGPGSAERRRAFLRFISLPQRLSGATLLKTLNAFLTKEDFLNQLHLFNG